MSTTAQTSAESSWQEFRSRRDERLAAPYSILAQVGLHWVDPDAGAQSLGDVPGTWEIIDGHLTGTWDGDALTLLAGAPEVEASIDGSRTTATVASPDDVRLASYGEDIRIDVIRRGDRIGLRLLDPASPRLSAFDGVPTFPYDPALVLTGTWRRDPGTVVVGSALPWLEQSLPSPGVATLDVAGTGVEVVLTDEANILFTDETSGTESADWRVVTAVLDGDALTVDLNRAVSFPSAFSAWGTCPRPPAGNHLPLAVRAGERRVQQTER
jgi:uncharacterized protein